MTASKDSNPISLGPWLFLHVAVIAAFVSSWSAGLAQGGLSHEKTVQHPAVVSDWLSSALVSQETKSQNSVGRGANVAMHSVTVVNPGETHDGVRLVWIAFPRNSFVLEVQRIDKIGPADDLYKATVSDKTALTVNGGPYFMVKGQTQVPLGVVIERGTVISPKAPFTSGGVVFSGSNIPVDIVGIKRFSISPGIINAIQAKPLLIENGRIAVGRDKTDRQFDRTAIGITANGDLVVAGAFRSDTQALTTYEFARFLALLRPLKGIALKTALNLDGATDAHIFFQPTAIHLGYHGTNYVPDVISIQLK